MKTSRPLPSEDDTWTLCLFQSFTWWCGDWNLYMSALKNRLPWFAAHDHTLYKMGCCTHSWHMAQAAPQVYQGFIDGDFCHPWLGECLLDFQLYSAGASLTYLIGLAGVFEQFKATPIYGNQLLLSQGFTCEPCGLTRLKSCHAYICAALKDVVRQLTYDWDTAIALLDIQ